MAFPPTLGWATLGPSTVGGKSWKSRLPTCRFGSWGLEAFRKAIEKAMEKIMEAIIEIFYTHLCWVFFSATNQHRFFKIPLQFCSDKDFLNVLKVFFVSNVFSVEIFISVESTTAEAREAPPEVGTAAAARGTHGCRTGSSWPRWWFFQRKKTKLQWKITFWIRQQLSSWKTKDIQICVLFFCGFHGWILGASTLKDWAKSPWWLRSVLCSNWISELFF